jgi:hypothetical protein
VAYTISELAGKDTTLLSSHHRATSVAAGALAIP